MPELSEPIPREWRRTLRAAVLQHATGERRARHPPLLHVGCPGASEHVVAALPDRDEGPASDDHALRVDVLAALLRRVGSCSPAPSPLVWLTRTGGLGLQDVDVRWLASTLAAGAEAEVDVTFVVVDRHGWRDPRTGAEAHWARLRAP